MTKLYPVIMCGGYGRRLWPESGPLSPKPFLPLLGCLSPFQETVLRVAPLAAPNAGLVVIAGVAHRPVIQDQLQAIGVDAQLILEPVARGSGPALAAAALWCMNRDSAAIAVAVASDHLIPDAQAFREAVHASTDAARSGQIVTLGVTPRSPSPADGYIWPAGMGLGKVRQFVEKPDVAAAKQFVAQGFLWNSGNFIASASTLIEEITAHCPGMLDAVHASMDQGKTEPLVLELGPAFAKAPDISIDRAVMERTSRAAVLPVAFAWSDIGDWAAVASTGRGDRGSSLQLDCSDLLVRAPEG